MDIIKETLKTPWYEPSKDEPENSNVWYDHIYTKDHKWLLYLDCDRWINRGGAQDKELTKLIKVMIINLPELYELMHQSYLLIRDPTFVDEDRPNLTTEDVSSRYEILRCKYLEAVKPVPDIETDYSDDGCYTTGERNLAVRFDCQPSGDAHPCHA